MRQASDVVASTPVGSPASAAAPAERVAMVATRPAVLLVSPAAATRLLASVAAILVLIAIGLAVIELTLGYDHMRGIVPMFSLTMEANVPSWYSGSLLLTTATLLLVIAHGSGGRAFGDAAVRDSRYWYGLAVVFAYLSMDELMQLHERTTQPVRDGLGTSGLLYYGWILPALLMVGLVGLVYVRFLFRLPRATARLFVIAAILYVGGAVGGEMLEGLAYSSNLEPYRKRLAIQAITIPEEAAEMAGVIVMIRALLLYVAANRERPAPAT